MKYSFRLVHILQNQVHKFTTFLSNVEKKQEQLYYYCHILFCRFFSIEHKDVCNLNFDLEGILYSVGETNCQSIQKYRIPLFYVSFNIHKVSSWG